MTVVITSLFLRVMLAVAVLAAMPGHLYANNNEEVTLYSVLKTYGYTETQCEGLRDLLSLYDVDLNESYPKKQAEQELVKKTQAACLRQGERFSSSEYNNALSARLLKHRAQLESAASKAGLIDGITPNPSLLRGPHIALIPGALDQRICSRFQALVDDIVSQGIVPNLVVAVTGYRDLESEEALDAALTERTEACLMAYRWQQYTQQHPELKNIAFLVSQAPLKPGQKRSNTFDTVGHLRHCCEHFFEETPQAVLYIEQPFAQRFLGIFQTLPVELGISARRLESLSNDKIYTYGDEVARAIYFYAQQK